MTLKRIYSATLTVVTAVLLHWLRFLFSLLLWNILLPVQPYSHSMLDRHVVRCAMSTDNSCDVSLRCCHVQLAGLLMLIFGIIAKVDQQAIADIFSAILPSASQEELDSIGVNISGIIVSNATFMIILGVIALVISVLGFFGACCMWRWMLVLVSWHFWAPLIIMVISYLFFFLKFCFFVLYICHFVFGLGSDVVVEIHKCWSWDVSENSEFIFRVLVLVLVLFCTGILTVINVLKSLVNEITITDELKLGLIDPSSILTVWSKKNFC